MIVQSLGATITPVSAIGSGAFNNLANLLIDGVIPAEATAWTQPTNIWWNGTRPTFTINLGNIYKVDDVTVSVDNSGSYRMQYSVDNAICNTLFIIGVADGEISFGMDTMSSDSTHPEHIANIEFASVQARYLRLFALSGDNNYAAAEIMPEGIPLPTAAWLAIPVLGWLGSVRLIRTMRFNR